MIAHLVRLLRRHLGWTVGLFFVMGLLATAGLRWNDVRQVQEAPEVRRAAVVEAALATVGDRFDRLRDRIRGQAERLAGDSVIVKGLSQWNREQTRPPALAQRLLDVSLAPHTTVEVYSPAPRILAWNGPRMPTGRVPETDAFLQRPQMEVLSERTVRQGLAVWWPVRTEDGDALGVVRVVRTLQYRPPVKNRYVRGFSVQDQWERETGESLRLTWGKNVSSMEGPHRDLRGANSVLGRVAVVSPSTERLRQRATAFYNDILAGWVVLLFGWGMVVVGGWYLQLARRPGLRRHARARTAAAGRLACAAALWVGGRYLLLALDVPVRWQDTVSFLSVLFDPTRFASTIGGGVFRSTGDLFLTAVWAVGLAAGGLHLALQYRPRAASAAELREKLRTHRPQFPSGIRYVGVIAGLVGVSLASILGVAIVVRRSVLDSTLDFFSRTGLLPKPLVLTVLFALVLLFLAVLMFGTACAWVGIRFGLRYRPQWPQGLEVSSVIVLFGGGVAALYLGPGAQAVVPFPYPLVFMGIVGAAAVYGMVGRNGGAEIVTVRGLLFSLFAVTLLFYPLLYAGMDAQRQERLVEAAESFEDGHDPRALYSIRQMLRGARAELAPMLTDERARETASIDSVATRLVRRSLLASLTRYDVTLALLDAEGQLYRRYREEGPMTGRVASRTVDEMVFKRLYRRHAQSSSGPVVERLARGPGGEEAQFQYVGLLRVGGGGRGRAGWLLLRAEPHTILPVTGPGVPRVLLPNGSFSDLYAEVSLAEFREGTLVRSYGEGFGRMQLPSSHEARLDEQETLWRTETVQGRPYLTYYVQLAETGATIAARIPSILAFDHLYYVLRLTVAGLGVALLAYLIGLYGRYRHGLLPAPRVRFRNKVLNAFLIVGVVSTVAVGVVGVRVVTGENERIVERRLRDQLSRVENALSLAARPEEALWQTAQRLPVDSLAARVGLDLRVYENDQLVGTSRPSLVRDGFVDDRLPGDVYHKIYDKAYRFAAVESAIGTFSYRVGYRALVDEEGRPRLVVGVPTLAQEEQVAEEQSRTLAYLFGALLVLVVVVIITAFVLANALAQPIARLRKGLEAVGEGRFAEALPVDTRDEIGDLVRTFNEMRSQLAESRRRLAQQERELAWREMARQVAHEIKNPLTPMKLSIQHLRRAFQQDAETTDESKFAGLFDRITGTLIEQIESLVRIADEFSTFARLPTRVTEPLDLNEVVREAVRLMEQDAAAQCIEVDLHPEPLVVEADREELRRTYINLLKNALQALSEDQDGRVRVTTTLVEDAEGPVVESCVVDNGTGIPAEVQDKIFEPNFSTKTSGTGLGLAIAQKTLDDLDGTIEYETTEGEGTTFRLQLPPADEADR